MKPSPPSSLDTTRGSDRVGEGWNGLKELNWRCGPELEGPELFNENGKNVLGEVL